MSRGTSGLAGHTMLPPEVDPVGNPDHPLQFEALERKTRKPALFPCATSQRCRLKSQYRLKVQATDG